MATARFEGLTEVQLSRILEITIPKMLWLSRRGLGPVRSAEISELVNQ